jgi:hypothetical protein
MMADKQLYPCLAKSEGSRAWNTYASYWKRAGWNVVSWDDIHRSGFKVDMSSCW